MTQHKAWNEMKWKVYKQETENGHEGRIDG
jgi:hypothetical protein